MKAYLPPMLAMSIGEIVQAAEADKTIWRMLELVVGRETAGAQASHNRVREGTLALQTSVCGVGVMQCESALFLYGRAGP